MSPSQREREYARRRYSDWQIRQAEKARRRRLRLRIAATVAAVVVVVGVVGGVYQFVLRDDTTTVADPGSTPSDTGAPDPANPCPAPTVQAPAEPLQLDTAPDPSAAEDRTWTATLATSCGDITVELYGDKAPQAVASFVTLAQAGYFTGTPCHRLTTEGIFVLQCGDPTGTGTGGPGYSFGPVENAPADDLYPTGTLAMARVGDQGDSMGSQFFLVYADSTIPADSAGGYTIFGRITAGLEIVQNVAQGGLGDDGVAPARAVSLDEVTVQ